MFEINKIYLLNTNQIDYDYWYSLMPNDRKLKIDKCIYLKDKLLSLGAGILLYNGLKELNIDYNITYNEYNKPYLDNIYFNISHSNNLVVCVFSDSEIGVDIEKIKPFDNIINNIFTTNEINYIKNNNQDNNLLYTKLWTIKESLLKYLGLGITINPKSINIDLSNESIKYNYLNKEVYFKTFIIDDYVLTICSEYKDFNEELEWFKTVYYENQAEFIGLE